MSYRVLQMAALGALMFGPAIARAHPHIFIETRLVVLTDGAGAVSGVEVQWTYDELYSMMLLDEMGLDQDYDGVLADGEAAALDGFDMNWQPGYAGDLYLWQGDGALELGAPEPLESAYEGGRVVSRHFRPLAAPVSGEVRIKAYDPTFYTAYDLGGGVDVPEGCEVSVIVADIKAAQDKANALIEELGILNTDVEYPEVGAEFADEVTVSCGG